MVHVGRQSPALKVSPAQYVGDVVAMRPQKRPNNASKCPEPAGRASLMPGASSQVATCPRRMEGGGSYQMRQSPGWTLYIPFNNPGVVSIIPFHKGVHLKLRARVTCPVSLRHTEAEWDLNPALSPQSWTVLFSPSIFTHAAPSHAVCHTPVPPQPSTKPLLQVLFC